MKLTSLVPLALLTLVLTQACSSLSPEQQLVAAAAEALGGRSAVEGVRTLRIEGGGTAYLLGQNLLPDSDLPTYTVTGYTRTIDLASGRTATRQTRTAQFAFAGNTVTTPHVGLDGDVAYNVTADGTTVRASERDAKDRRIEMMHHPVTIVRAALDPATTVSNLRQQGDESLVEVTTAKGDMLTLAVNRATKLPSRVQSKAAHPNLGDVTITTAFQNYQDVGGVTLPASLVTTTDDYPQLTIDVKKNEVNVDAASLAASVEVKAAAPPTPPAQVVTVEPVSKGIWWLAGSGNHHMAAPPVGRKRAEEPGAAQAGHRDARAGARLPRAVRRDRQDDQGESRRLSERGGPQRSAAVALRRPTTADIASKWRPAVTLRTNWLGREEHDAAQYYPGWVRRSRALP